MKIAAVYKTYRIPPNLQEHMFRVAAVGALVADHWVNKTELDRDVLIKALLLHDTGNIVKMNFQLSHLLGSEEKRIDYWKNVQKEFFQKYGTDEHAVTESIAKELHVESAVLDLLNRTENSTILDALHISNWNKKVYAYADNRVAPYGVVSINERFDDIVKRYKNTNHYLSDQEGVEKRRQWTLKLEEQIKPKVTIDLHTITNESIQGYLKEVQMYSL